MGRADREGAKQAALDVSPEEAPANSPSDEGRERGRIEHATGLAAPAEQHAIEACRLSKAKPEHMWQLEVGPNRDELLQGARHLADGGGDERAVDCADARPRRSGRPWAGCLGRRRTH